MAEQLLSPTDVYKKLRISRAKFYRIRAKLIANGLQVVKIEGSIKYRQLSLDKMIARAADTETDLCGK